MSRIKICGLFREEDIDAANEASPDFVGFVFAPSKRRVSPAQAARLRSRLAPNITPVGVFVNAPIEDVAALLRNGVIDVAQLHGSEDAAYIAALKVMRPAPLIKAVSVPPSGVFPPPPPSADYILFDNGSGGTGTPFPWFFLNSSSSGANSLSLSSDFPKSSFSEANSPSLSSDSLRPSSSGSNVLSLSSDFPRPSSSEANSLSLSSNFPKPPSGEADAPSLSADFTTRCFLAGGINLENIAQALAFNPFAIDISSGAETNGVKDRQKMITLTRITRDAASQEH